MKQTEQKQRNKKDYPNSVQNLNNILAMPKKYKQNIP